MSVYGIRTPGKSVAVKPFEVTSAQAKVSHGIAVMSTRLELKKLEVMFDNHEMGLQAGDSVWIHSDVVSKHAWAKQVYEANGRSFILAPSEFILVIEANPE